MNLPGALTIAIGVALGILMAVAVLGVLARHGGALAVHASTARAWLYTRRWGIAGAAAVVLLGIGGAAFEAERPRINRNIEDARIAGERYSAEQARWQREREAMALAKRRLDCREELDGWNRYVAEMHRDNRPIRVDIIAERFGEREQCERILAGKAAIGTSDAKQARPAD
jgi:hypothetical protein